MSTAIITSIISATSIILGSLVGALCSFLINKNINEKRIKEDYKIIEANRKYDKICKEKELCNNANIIRLDIITAIFQSIRSLQNKDKEKNYLYLMPLHKEYSLVVVSLSDKYTLQELSLIYQLYGIIEKVNRDIQVWKVGDNRAYDKVLKGFKSILYKIYKDNYESILKVNPDMISYEELYNNEYINADYKEVLKKLDKLCFMENKTEK
ncbi:MAG: hypothetical protein V8R02_11700 [Clostridium sp.]